MIRVDREPWRDHAACLGVDPDLFFPEQGEDIQPALTVCETCTVRDECLEAGLEHPMVEFGIWGGRPANQRIEARRRRRTSSVPVSDEGSTRRTSARRSDGVPTGDRRPVPHPLTPSPERCAESASRVVRHERRRTPMTTNKKPTTMKPAKAKTKSVVSKDGTITCTGTCGETMPETKFPTMRTKDGTYVRRDECRACQATRRAAARDEKAKANR